MTRAPRRYLPAYLLIAPAVALFLLMAAGPLGMGIYLSLCELNIGADRYVGLANFRALLADPEFRSAMGRTLVYVAAIVPGLQVTALATALLAHAVGGRLKDVLRAMVYVVGVTSGVMTLGIWRWLWHPTPRGGFNALLRSLHLPAPNWLAYPATAMVAICVTVVAWNYGSYFVLYLAGLDGQDRSVHEAAMIDGCSAWQRAWYVTVPLLRRIALYQFVVATVGVVQLWECVAILSGGGPSGSTKSMGYVLFEQAAIRGEYGMASAISVTMLAVILVLVAVQNVWLRERA